MTHHESHSRLRDEGALRWSCLEDEREGCIVVSERMELVYINAAARELMPGGWFGNRCFEVLPIVDETCEFQVPKPQPSRMAARASKSPSHWWLLDGWEAGSLCRCFREPNGKALSPYA